MQFFPVKNKNAKVSSYYGRRINPFTGLVQDHKGIDIAVSIGTEVFSPLSGMVLSTGEKDNIGKFIYVTSGDYKFLFGHLSKILVKEGDQVSKEKPIALSGKSGKVTGSHLHFAVYYKNQPINPLTGTTPQENQLIVIPILGILLYIILKQK